MNARPGHRAAFRRDGFLVLQDCLDRGDVEEVRSRLDRCFDCERAEKVRALKGPRVLEICRAIRVDASLRRNAVFRRCQDLAAFLHGSRVRYAFDHAIYKEPGADTEIGWHQDQAYQRFDLAMRSYHFWIPLQDVDDRNGTLQFVAGSHRLGALPHEDVTGSNTKAVRQRSDWSVHTVALHVGGLSVHHPLTLHRSVGNGSTMPRRAWILHFGPHGKLDALRWDNLREQVRRRIRT